MMSMCSHSDSACVQMMPPGRNARCIASKNGCSAVYKKRSSVSVAPLQSTVTSCHLAYVAIRNIGHVR
jgi:hypothetical protein